MRHWGPLLVVPAVLFSSSTRLLADPPPESAAWMFEEGVRDPQRPRLRWLLQVSQMAKTPYHSVYELAETREGDVPLPEGTKWKCRYEGICPLKGDDLPSARIKRGPHWNTGRDLVCSSDDWATSVSTSAGIFWVLRDGDTLADSAKLTLRTGRTSVMLELLPCPPGTRDGRCARTWPPAP